MNKKVLSYIAFGSLVASLTGGVRAKQYNRAADRGSKNREYNDSSGRNRSTFGQQCR